MEGEAESFRMFRASEKSLVYPEKWKPAPRLSSRHSSHHVDRVASSPSFPIWLRLLWVKYFPKRRQMHKMWFCWFIQWYLIYIVREVCMKQLVIHFGPSPNIIINVSVNTLPPTPQISRSVTGSEEICAVYWDFSYVFLTNVDVAFWKIKSSKLHT
jgi:hypothetical protein